MCLGQEMNTLMGLLPSLELDEGSATMSTVNDPTTESTTPFPIPFPCYAAARSCPLALRCQT